MWNRLLVPLALIGSCSPVPPPPPHGPDLADRLLRARKPLRLWREQLADWRSAHGAGRRLAWDDPPADEAPLEHLALYWRAQHVRAPSARVRQRLVEASERFPEHRRGLRRHLPESPAAPPDLERLVAQVRRLHTQWQSIDDADHVGRLCRLDWPRGRAVLRELAERDDPLLVAFALRRLYVERLRRDDVDPALPARLQRLALDRGAADRARAEAALGALAGPTRPGWLRRLLAEPAARGEWITRALWRWIADDPAPRIARVARALGDPATRWAALGCLVPFGDRDDALRAVAPWLGDPGWLREPEGWRDGLGGHARQARLLTPLSEDPQRRVPAVLPGCVRILLQDGLLEDGDRSLASDVYRVAGRVLCRHANPRTDLLRPLLTAPGVPEARRAGIAMALLPRMADAEVAGWIAIAGGLAAGGPLPGQVYLDAFFPSGRPADLPVRDGVARELLRRIARSVPARREEARALWDDVQDWPTPSVYRELVRRLGTPDLDGPTLVRALDVAPRLRAADPVGLRRLATGTGPSAGFAAIVADDAVRIEWLLGGTDTAAQRALLAAARWTDRVLPLDRVRALLDVPAVRPAAWSYLRETERPVVRELAWRLWPGALLGRPGGLGAGHFSRPGPFADWEARLQAELHAAGGPDEIHALFCDDPDARQIVVRVRAGRARLSVEWRDRQAARDLTAAELASLRRALDCQWADRLQPLAPMMSHPRAREYLRLSPARGWRVWMEDPTARAASPWDLLVRRVEALADAVPLTPRLRVLDALPGARILGEGDIDRCRLSAGRLFVRVREAERVRWRALDGRLGQPASATPPGVPVAAERIVLPGGDELVAGGALERRSGGGTTRLAAGWFQSLVLAPDGRMLYVARRAGSEYVCQQLVRVDLATGLVDELATGLVDELDVGFDVCQPLAWSPTRKRLLVWCRDVLRVGWEAPQVVWLAPETGATTQASVEHRPLLDARLAGAQSAGSRDVRWAALRTRWSTTVGRYDARAFAFTPRIELPGLQLTSDQLAVDEAARRLVVVHRVGDRGRVIEIRLPPGR